MNRQFQVSVYVVIDDPDLDEDEPLDSVHENEVTERATPVVSGWESDAPTCARTYLQGKFESCSGDGQMVPRDGRDSHPVQTGVAGDRVGTRGPEPRGHRGICGGAVLMKTITLTDEQLEDLIDSLADRIEHLDGLVGIGVFDPEDEQQFVATSAELDSLIDVLRAAR